jgi:hypothetical protein
MFKSTPALRTKVRVSSPYLRVSRFRVFSGSGEADNKHLGSFVNKQKLPQKLFFCAAG